VICRIVLTILLLAYFFALGVYAVGTFGWFGVESDPLSGAYLIILGMPWILLPFDPIAGESWLPLIGIVAPLVNLAIVLILCRWLSRPRSA
jgi:hypothetical protein